MIKKLQIVKNMGIKWTLFRAQYEAQKKLGLLKRKFPAVKFTDEDFLSLVMPSFRTRRDFVNWWKANKPPFFFTCTDLQTLKELLLGIRGEGNGEVILLADDIVNHKYRYFSKVTVVHHKLDWHLNPMNNLQSPRHAHWTEIPDLSEEFGDIKNIWELSRFSAVYTLVRAYAVTADPKYAEHFWIMVEDWERNNSPELGVNWKCGQELSMRIMAWFFGLYAFSDLECSTDERIFSLLKQICFHADHIEKHFRFALYSVRNNHAISEAAGMYTAGVLCPFYRNAGRLREKGKQYLESEGLRQIYDDGSYLQHSMNYHRLVIQTYTWSLRLGQLNDDVFDQRLQERLRQSVLFLYSNQDRYTGRLPNYGNNDGTLLLPLSCSEYLDYRPQLNAMNYVLCEHRLYPEGWHDEDLLWLCGRDALKAPVKQPEFVSSSFETGGYYTIRTQDSFAMIRCASYRDRPMQADMLHLDLWWKGYNILCDAGTFSYNTASDWIGYFSGTCSHNTISINAKDQMDKGARFLWYNWTKSKKIQSFQQKGIQYFEGEHYGYHPLIHRRTVIQFQDVWVVIDDVKGRFGEEPCEVSQHWLFEVEADLLPGLTVKLNTAAGGWSLQVLDGRGGQGKLYYGEETPPRGWRSLYYGVKDPCHQFIRTLSALEATRLVTLIKPLTSEMKVCYDEADGTLMLGHIRIPLNPVSGSSILNQEEWHKLEV